MSYAFHMEADLGGPAPERLDFEHLNYTYNVSPMFKRAIPGGIGMRGLDGKTGAELLPLLHSALVDMEAFPAAYRGMNPPNGWGNYEGACRVIRTLLDWARRAPQARLVIS